MLNSHVTVVNTKEVGIANPYIHNTPADNILLSAAILFSGSLPSKVLRVFK